MYNYSVMIKYTDEMLLELVPLSKSLSDFIRKMGLPTSGNYYAIFRHRISKLNIDTSHWRHPNCKYLSKDTSPNEIAKKKKAVRFKLLRLRGNTCQKCKNTTWFDQPITLEVHHIDGDTANNTEDNLQLLCPNCHSLTENWRGRRNKKEYVAVICSCGIEISKNSKKCRSCSAFSRNKFEITKDELEKLILQHPLTKIGEMFGVSDNAIRKRAKKLGICSVGVIDSISSS